MADLDATLQMLARAPITTIPVRVSNGARFVKGPIPLEWLGRAARLPGRALHVGLVCWYRRGIVRRDCVSLSRIDLEQFGIDRFAAYRGLRALERQGLVSVERHPGRVPLVTIIVPSEASAS